MKRALFILVTFAPVLVCANVKARTEIDLGYGSDGALISLEAGIRYKRFGLSIESMYNFEELLGSKLPAENKWENNLFIGYNHVAGNCLFELKSGVGHIYFKERTGEVINSSSFNEEYRYNDVYLWGIPIEFIVTFKVNEKVYIGLGSETFLSREFQRFGLFIPVSIDL